MPHILVLGLAWFLVVFLGPVFLGAWALFSDEHSPRRVLSNPPDTMSMGYYYDGEMDS